MKSDFLTPEESRADYIASCEVGNAAIRAKAGPFGDLKRGHYGAILADPPWHFQAWVSPKWTSSRPLMLVFHNL